MTLNVDNFDITTHIHINWFWIVWTKCWNWGNLSFFKIQRIEFLIHTGTYFWHIRKKNQFDQKILPQDKYFSKKVLFGRNSFIKQLFWTHYTEWYQFFKIRLYQKTYLKEGEGANLPLHPHFRRKGGAAPDRLCTPTWIRTWGRNIIILFLSNIVMFRPYSWIKIAIYMNITSPVISFCS